MNDGYGAPQAFCPRCGSSAEVRTIKELFDWLNALQANAARQAAQAPQPAARGDNPGNDPYYYNPENQAGRFVFGLVGQAIGKRWLRASANRAAQAQAEAQVEARQAQLDQVAIVERYPDLRGCMRDFVLFLPGGTSAVPIAEVHLPPTLAAVDALVARLRAS